MCSSANTNEMAAKKFWRRLDSIRELPTLSMVVQQLDRMLRDINVSAQDVTKVIEHDQSIVMKMLKLANSAFFGFSTKISSEQHALMLLGFNAVYNVIISIEVIDALKLKEKIQGLDIKEFWKHTIAVATIGSYLDQQTGGHCQEDVFTCGIIHDIGKIVMAHHFADLFQATWDTMLREGLTFWEAERRHFPVNHAVIGEHLSQRWHLPPLMQRVIGQHYTNSSSDAVDRLIYIVHAADALHHVFLEKNAPTADWPICMGARQLLRPQINTADQWISGLKKEIKEACQILMEDQ